MITRLVKLKPLYSISFKLKKIAVRFRAVHNAAILFDNIPQRNSEYSHTGKKYEALRVFRKQLQMGLSEIGEVEVALALKACRNDTRAGAQIHSFAVTRGLVRWVSVSNSLMNMYCKSGCRDQAICIFNRLENPDTVSRNTVLSGFQDGEEALVFARYWHSSGVAFDAVSCTVILSLSAEVERFRFGEQVHCLVQRFGLERELYVGNALLSMYSKWGRMIEAERVFCQIPVKDTVSWNAMISGYAREGRHTVKALSGFVQMVRGSWKPDRISFASVTSACGHERNLGFGKQLHGLIIKGGCETDVSVGNNLISMYWKCDLAEDAKLVFGRMGDRDVVSWTTMISVDEEDAVSIFKNMRRKEVYPNEITFLGLLHAITVKVMKLEGRMVHTLCMKMNFLSNVNVSNCFVTMYAKFESMQDSLKIFEELDDRETLVSWNALISGYVQNGMYHDALETFFSASLELQPSEYTFGSVLNAIGSSESIPLCYGQRCHAYLVKLGLNFDPIVLGSLLDMYAKRGSIHESLKVFYENSENSQVAWTAIISAHSRHGDFESVMSLFNEMENCVKPDSITFLSVLTACGRKGAVDTGFQIFNSMLKDHSIEPSSEHYSCMVDMLGRTGKLKEAEELMDQIPGGPGLSVLLSLLGSCRIHGDVDLAARLTDDLIRREPENSGSYVLMSNLFAEKGLWGNAAKIRKRMRDEGVKKEVAFSWVDAGSASDSVYMHGFSSDDKSHPKSEEIYQMAEWLGSEMKFVEEDKENDFSNT